MLKEHPKRHLCGTIRDQQVQIETGVWDQGLRNKENSFTWLQKSMSKKKIKLINCHAFEWRGKLHC